MPVISREGSLLWMMDKVEERISELVNKFREKFEGRTKFNIVDPELIFAKRGVTAGTCYFNYNDGKGLLNFNRVIMVDNWNRFDQTVIHEVAHYCCALLYGRRVIHGREWQNMMFFFGAEADRCHSYDVSRVRKTYTYTCGCGSHELTSIRHNRMQKNASKYFCTKCKQTIKYVDNA